MNAPLLAFVGDDFTGSTDVLEALAVQGVETALFLQPPSPGDLARFPACRAVGVATVARSLAPAALEAVLRPAFAALHALGPDILHYKVCSTFDSSPAVGSIGRALEIGRAITGTPRVPVVVAAPHLRRHVVFGNLFAGVGDATHRLDRHPTMSRHPLTPMAEADLRRHLALQTPLACGLVDVLALNEGVDAAVRRLNALDDPVVVLDTLDEDHEAVVGELLWEGRAELGRFVVGSSGVEWALGTAWRRRGIAPPVRRARPADAVGQLLVFSASASPVTAAQIARARERGWATVRLDMPRLARGDPAARDAALHALVAAWSAGASVVAHAAEGPDDPALAATRASLGGVADAEAGARVAEAVAALLADTLRVVSARRVCVCGGDTSGAASRALGIVALTFRARLAPGAPLCEAHLDGGGSVELVLKGGQNGGPDFLECVRAGSGDGRATPSP